MRHVFNVLGMMLLVVCLSSCSSNDEENNVKDQQVEIQNDAAYEELRSRIHELNMEFGGSNWSEQTRLRLPRWFSRVYTLVVSDAVGAILGSGGGLAGAIIGAGVASASACVAYSTGLVEVPCINSPANYAQLKMMAMDGLIFADSLSATKSDSIGYYHNSVLFSLYEDAPELLDSLGDNHTCLFDSIASRHELFGCNTIELPDSFVVETDTLIQDFLQHARYSDNLTNLPSGIFWQAHNIEYFLVIDYFNYLLDQDESFDVKQYTSRYLKTITASDLHPEQKEAVKYAITVGYSSLKLWKSGAIKGIE